jgi:hypothetical protein
MNCDTEKDSIIVTLALQGHGKIIELDLPPDIGSVFENVRLFSQSGTCSPVYSTDAFYRNILSDINRYFQRNLDTPTLNVIDDYIEEFRPKYQKQISDLPLSKTKDVCKLIHNITFDKLFTTATPTYLSYLTNPVRYVLPEIQGIYLISVHKKVNSHSFELFFPSKYSRNLNLLNISDFQRFAQVFHMPLSLDRFTSSQLPENYFQVFNEIQKNEEWTEMEKEEKVKELNEEYYDILKDFRISLDDSKKQITDIRFSTLVKLIQYIVGESCKINLLDYTCSNVTTVLPKYDNTLSQYFMESDIETANEKRGWGKRKSQRKRKSLRVRRQRKKSLRKRL